MDSQSDSDHQPIQKNAKTMDQNSDSEGFDGMCQIVVTYHCKQCTFVCQEKASLKTHFKESHPASSNGGGRIEENYKPPADNNQVPSTLESPEIPPSDQEKEVFLCAECNIVFPTEEACCAHMIDVHGLMDFDANLIRDNRNKKPPMERQRRIVKPPKALTLEGGSIVPRKYRVGKDMPLKCSMCPVRFESSENRELHEQCHVRKEVDVTPLNSEKKEKFCNIGFSCLICATKGSVVKFPRWSMCAVHLWKIHQIDCELYGCGTCPFKTHLITKLREHEGIHTTIPTFKCETCHKTFKQLKQLKTHEKFHKEKMTKLPPPTDSRWYTPKECSICKRILSDSKCLRKHISAVHNKLKPYVCNICGHTSARKAELQLHVRQHTGEKPYKCSTCEFATGDHNSLRKHQFRHTEIRPYACPFCKYRCIQSCAYKKHMISVHPEKDVIFACPYCNLVSVSDTFFQSHIKDHEEGRVPHVDMQNESSSSPNPTEANDDGEKPSAESIDTKIDTQKRNGSDLPYWMREDDSIDMIDTGGFTIPAPPSEAATNSIETVSVCQKNEGTNLKAPVVTIKIEEEVPINSNPNVETIKHSSTVHDASLEPQGLQPIEAQSRSTDLELEDVLYTEHSDQVNNDRMFARLIGLNVENSPGKTKTTEI